MTKRITITYTYDFDDEEEVEEDIDGRKIFGGAMKFNETETNKLKQLDDERA